MNPEQQKAVDEYVRRLTDIEVSTISGFKTSLRVVPSKVSNTDYTPEIDLDSEEFLDMLDHQNPSDPVSFVFQDGKAFSFPYHGFLVYTEVDV